MSDQRVFLHRAGRRGAVWDERPGSAGGVREITIDKVVFRSLLLVSELLVLKLSPICAGMDPLWEASEAMAAKSREPR